MSNQSIKNNDGNLREYLKQLLESGLETKKEPRAYEHQQVLEIIAQLQKISPDDYKNKLIIAGFTLSPYHPADDPDDEQVCETCMYFQVHRKYCELPELMLPVEPEWSCRLWRI